MRAERANEVSNSPAPGFSPTLVLVLTCLTVALLVCPPAIALLLELWRCLVSGTRWSRVNVSITRIFEM